jgi:hypothetical protein
MVPDAMDFADKLTMELAVEFGEGIVIEPDFSQIRALQEDKTQRAELTIKGWDAGVVQFDELRVDLGKEPVGEEALETEEGEEPLTGIGKKYKWQLPQAKAAVNALEGEEPNSEGTGEEEERDPEQPDGDTEEQSYAAAAYREMLASKRPSWRRLHEAADDKQLSIRRCVSKGFRLAKEGVEVQALANAIFTKDSMKAEALALAAFRENGLPVIRSTMTRVLGSLYRSGAKVGGRDARVKLGAGPSEKFAPPTINAGEDESFAETRVGELVTDVTEATRSIIRQHVEGMFEDGYSARRAATRIRDTIGLTKLGLRRLQKFEERQRERGVTGDALDESLSRFSRKLIRERALTIARTESIRAVSEGQSSIWEKAVEGGILPPDQEIFWITTDDERLCPICAPMDGQTIKVGEMFSTGDGDQVDGPPVHPNCRCARGLK